jgi:WD40 repeat protein
VPSGELKATLKQPGSQVGAVAFSADGKALVLGGGDRTVKLWELATGATRTVGAHLGPVNAVAFFPNSQLLASASSDGTVKVWDAGPGRDAPSFAHKSAIRSLAFAPDSKSLLVGSDLPTVVLDAATGKETATLPAGGVLGVSADANLLAARAPDDKRVIWDVAAARARAILPVGPDLGGAAFSRDGKTVVTWTDRGVGLWDVETSRVRLTLNPNGFGGIHCAAFSPDGRTLAIGRQFGMVTLWDLTTGQQRMSLLKNEGTTRNALAVAFSNDGKTLAAGNNEGAVRLWDAETGQLKVSFKGHTDAVRAVAFSPDDKTLLSGSADRTARLWDVVTGQELLTLRGHQAPVGLVVFAPDGKRLATAGSHEVKLWLASTEVSTSRPVDGKEPASAGERPAACETASPLPGRGGRIVGYQS